MVEITLRVVDNPTKGDPFFDCKVSRRGDVISVQGDNEYWGPGDLSHAFWRLIRLPNVSLNAATALLAGEMPRVDGTNLFLQPRMNMLSIEVLSGLSDEIASFLADDTRRIGIMTIEHITDTNLLLFIRRKAPYPDVGV